MVGSGKAHVHTVVSIAQAQCLDGDAPEAIRSFASLGAHGSHASKEERDLHRWLQNLYGIELRVYYVPMTLEAPSQLKSKCFFLAQRVAHRPISQRTYHINIDCQTFPGEWLHERGSGASPYLTTPRSAGCCAPGWDSAGGRQWPEVKGL